jgi:3-O-methylgallate 3,4-dioxygenase
MARITLGLGTSHSPQLSIPAEHWLQRGEEDHRHQSLYTIPDGRHVTYDELAAGRDPIPERELAPEMLQKRHEANQRGIEQVGEVLEQAAPDVLVAIGDDQRELFRDDNMPGFCVYWGEQVPYVPRNRGNGSASYVSQFYPAEPCTYPGCPDLALHIIHSLVDQGFDVAHSKFVPEGQSISHALTFVYARQMKHKIIPVVPIFQNTYFPPNQPPPKRSYEFGIALRNAIETWPSNARVGVLASGGLSHFVVDEELDRKVLKALMEKDADTLTTLPRERLQAGTSEIRNWIAVGAAVQHLDMELFDYVPCYRSPAGTGCAMAFAQWT